MCFVKGKTKTLNKKVCVHVCARVERAGCRKTLVGYCVPYQTIDSSLPNPPFMALLVMLGSFSLAKMARC